MATVYFLGNASATDFSVGTNFNTAPDGSGSSGAPSSGDTLVFASGNQTISAGFAALAGVALARVEVRPGCAVSVSAGQSLTLDVSSGSGYMSYSGHGGLFSVTAGSGGIDRLDVFSSTGNFRLVGGTTADLRIMNGSVYVGGSAVVTACYMAGGSLEAEVNGTAFTTLDVSGGSATVRRGITTLHLTSGGSVVTLDVAPITTANINSGRFNPRSRSTIGTCNLRGGELTPAGGYGPTITTLNVYGRKETTRYVSSAGGVAFAATPVYFGSAIAEQTDFPNS